MPKKKAISGNRGRSAKATDSSKDVDRYLAAVPEPARGTLITIRANIRSAMPPEATEAIGYGIPMFKYDGVRMWYAAFSKHCSLFPGSLAVIAAFKNDLKNCQISKGTIRFPVDNPLSATLVKKMVKARIAENERKKKATGG
jgi:uncharacterized protein YdhG (YjbR/CyaY superfamily)